MVNPELHQVQMLTELRLNKCGIPDQGGVALARALLNGNNVRPKNLCILNPKS